MSTLDQFLAGKGSLFFVVAKSKDATLLDLRDFAKRKTSEDKVAILCWRNREAVEKFVQTDADVRLLMRIEQITGKQFVGMREKLGITSGRVGLELDGLEF